MLQKFERRQRRASSSDGKAKWEDRIKTLLFFRRYRKHDLTGARDPTESAPFFENYNRGGLIIAPSELKPWAAEMFAILREQTNFSQGGNDTLLVSMAALKGSESLAASFTEAWVEMVECDTLRQSSDMINWMHTQLLTKVFNAR